MKNFPATRTLLFFFAPAIFAILFSVIAFNTYNLLGSNASGVCQYGQLWSCPYTEVQLPSTTTAASGTQSQTINLTTYADNDVPVQLPLYAADGVHTNVFHFDVPVTLKQAYPFQTTNTDGLSVQIDQLNNNYNETLNGYSSPTMLLTNKQLADSDAQLVSESLTGLPKNQNVLIGREIMPINGVVCPGSQKTIYYNATTFPYQTTLSCDFAPTLPGTYSIKVVSENNKNLPSSACLDYNCSFVARYFVNVMPRSADDTVQTNATTALTYQTSDGQSTYTYGTPINVVSAFTNTTTSAITNLSFSASFGNLHIAQASIDGVDVHEYGCSITNVINCKGNIAAILNAKALPAGDTLFFRATLDSFSSISSSQKLLASFTDLTNAKPVIYQKELDLTAVVNGKPVSLLNATGIAATSPSLLTTNHNLQITHTITNTTNTDLSVYKDMLLLPIDHSDLKLISAMYTLPDGSKHTVQADLQDETNGTAFSANIPVLLHNNTQMQIVYTVQYLGTPASVAYMPISGAYLIDQSGSFVSYRYNDLQLQLGE